MQKLVKSVNEYIIHLSVYDNYFYAILNFSNPRGLTTGSIKWSSMNGYRGQATVIRKFGEVENGVTFYSFYDGVLNGTRVNLINY